MSSADAQSDAIIRLKGIHKSFGSLRVLEGIDLDFHESRTTVVLGPSGTGKSVLLKIIVGLLRPDRGEVYIDDQRVDTLSESEFVEVRTQFGFLFQMGALFDSMTVAENVCFPLGEHTPMSGEEQRDRCDQVLRLVGLGGMERKMPAQLSGGQRKRIALARAIALEPRFILYDEPTTGLDPIRADVINELILRLQRKLNVTSIAVTHDMASAYKIADRLVMLYDGRIIADGTPDEIQNSENPMVRRFIRGEADEGELEKIAAETAQPFGGDSS